MGLAYKNRLGPLHGGVGNQLRNGIFNTHITGQTQSLNLAREHGVSRLQSQSRLQRHGSGAEAGRADAAQGRGLQGAGMLRLEPHQNLARHHGRMLDNLACRHHRLRGDGCQQEEQREMAFEHGVWLTGLTGVMDADGSN